MEMLMIVFRAVLKERVHELLRACGVMAYTEIPETVGTGQSGSTEGISFYAGENSIILVSLEPAQRDKVAGAVKAWLAEAQRSGWVKPAIRVFAWPCSQLS
jgi:nitrogen regulatory protein PII